MEPPDSQSRAEPIKPRKRPISKHQLATLIALCRFASVSGSPAHEDDVRRCASFLRDHLEAIGLEHARLVPTSGSPLVTADWLHAHGAPTVLVYGHYDVQPAEPLEAWTTPPFEPAVRDGRLYARGASDNKGQLVAALAALEELLAHDGRLPCNVSVLLDGEEETRTDNLEAFLRVDTNDGLLAADVALVTDSGVLAEGRPGVVLGLRGIAAVRVDVRTAPSDLHSGVWGGIVPNAIDVLCRLLAGLVDPVSGRVLVDGFYDRVAEVPPEEASSLAELPVDGDALAAQLGVAALTGERDRDVRERLWARPTLDVYGIRGGFGDDGLKPIVPCTAYAKLSCRLVPEQTPEEVVALLERHLTRRAPDGVTVEVTQEVTGARPVVLPVGHPMLESARSAVREGFGVEASDFRAGFSVPVVELLARIRSLDSVLLGFMHPDENMHAPDEFVRLDVIGQAIATYAAFFRHAAAAGRSQPPRSTVAP